jgi:uncharacterized protein YciI
MMKCFVCCCLLAILFACHTPAVNQVADPAVADTLKRRMKQYWLTFLLKGHNRSQDSAIAAQIQAAHIRNIERLAAEGKIVMAGPMGYDRDLRGIFIIDAKDSAEAASYINTDSAVVTGRLRFELHPWWTQTGTYRFQ